MVATGDIFRSACICFLVGTVRSVSDVRVGGASDSAGGASGIMTPSCLGFH